MAHSKNFLRLSVFCGDGFSATSWVRTGAKAMSNICKEEYSNNDHLNLEY